MWTNFKGSFTRTINVTVFVTGTFDLFEGHFDGENGVQPILPVKVSITINTMLNFDGHGDSDVTCEQTLILAPGGSSYVTERVKVENSRVADVTQEKL